MFINLYVFTETNLHNHNDLSTCQHFESLINLLKFKFLPNKMYNLRFNNSVYNLIYFSNATLLFLLNYIYSMKHYFSFI